MASKKLYLIALMGLLVNTAQAEEITVTVKGMVCSFCAQGIKKTFSKNEKVENVLVDLDRKLVTIKTRDGTDLPDEELKRTINDAGYDVEGIKRGKDA